MAKGTQYEIQVTEWVEAQLAAGNYGIIPSLATVRRKPSYFSRDRNKDIVFDVSIEVRREGALEPYMIWVWECKNYTNSVPVDDLEEFHAKLSQIGADRTKGSMITSAGFDSGGVAFAKSKGIGLWRFVPPSSSLCIMEDGRGVADADIFRGLITPDTTKFRHYGFFYGLTTSGQFTTDRAGLLRAEFGDIAGHAEPGAAADDGA